MGSVGKVDILCSWAWGFYSPWRLIFFSEVADSQKSKNTSQMQKQNIMHNIQVGCKIEMHKAFIFMISYAKIQDSKSIFF